MQVMDGNGVFGCLETKVIGGSVGRAPADPSPCHPKGEPPMIVIPPLGGPSPTLIHLDRRGSTELARTENERFIQQAPLFEVDDQGRQALITLIGYLAMGILDVGMAVPWLKIPMPGLNKAHPSLDQSSGDQKLSILRAFPIELEHVLRLLTDIKGIGRLKLHAIGQFEGLDTRFNQ